MWGGWMGGGAAQEGGGTHRGQGHVVPLQQATPNVSVDMPARARTRLACQGT